MQQDMNHNNPQNWKWGIFYISPKDSRLIVPKRIKSLGWTLNFAHSSVWTGMILIILILVAVKILT